jgi:AraC-like DNA-binding protein/TolB-like protein
MSTTEFVHKVRQIVLDNLTNEHFGVKTLAKAYGLSRSQLFKKLKKYTGKSVSQFIKEIRLKKAHQLLKEGKLSVSEVSYQVGFSSPTYFASSFKEYFGFSPSTIRHLENAEGWGLNHIEVNNEQPKEVNESFKPSKSRYRNMQFFAIFLLVVALGVFYFSTGANKSAMSEKAVAVLRFDHIGNDNNEASLANGLADEIVNTLSNIKILNVTTSASSFKINKTDKLSEIGAQLGVNYVVDGLIWNDNDLMNATIKLIDVNTGYQLWANTYEEEVETFFNMQEHISRKVASELKITLLSKEELSLTNRKTKSFEAYELYSRAIIIGEKRQEETLDEAIELLENAVSLDSEFAEAYAELAFLYGQKHFYGNLSKEERDKKMNTNIQRAAELAPESPEVLLAIANHQIRSGKLMKDSSKIIASIRKAIELKPTHARANYQLYQALRTIRKEEVAHKYLKKAATLDSLSGFYTTILARDLFWQRNKKEEGFELIEEVLSENPREEAAYFKALMLVDEPRGNYMEAYKIIHEGLKKQSYAFGYLYWGSLLALDLDFLPLAKKFVQLIQLRFPDNPIYTYRPTLEICIREGRFDDALDLIKIWVKEKGLDKEEASKDLTRVYFLKRDLAKSKEILFDNFSDLLNIIEKGEQPKEDLSRTKRDIIRTYIEILRMEGEKTKAAFFADYLCQYFEKNKVRSGFFGKKYDLMEYYYLQNDLNPFLQVANEYFFERKSRLGLFTSLKSSKYLQFQENEEYQKLFTKIESEMHRSRAQVFSYLKEEGDWDPNWNTDLVLN